MDAHFSTNHSHLNAKALDELLTNPPPLRYLVILATILGILYLFRARTHHSQILLNANKLFFWEPAFFARLRWITNAQQIIDAFDLG